MESATLREKADAFRRLHAGPGIFVLPNVWDVVTARVVEAAWFPALATTSAGVAWALGYRDGERISRDEMLAAVGRIARTLRVPVTADMEAAYGAARADCLFVPHVSDAETIARLVSEIEGPLNVIAGPPAPPIPELARLGVRRASLGPRLIQATLGLLRRVVLELRGHGTYEAMRDLIVPFGELQRVVGG